MRTTLFIVAGLLILAAFFMLARLFTDNFPSAMTTATAVFLIAWLLITAFNMWVGVTRAGYSAGEEFPVLLVNFGVPAALALLLKWKVF